MLLHDAKRRESSELSSSWKLALLSLTEEPVHVYSKEIEGEQPDHVYSKETEGEQPVHVYSKETEGEQPVPVYSCGNQTRGVWTLAVLVFFPKKEVN